MAQDPMMAIAIQLERIANAVEKQNRILEDMQSDLPKQIKTSAESIKHEIHLATDVIENHP